MNVVRWNHIYQKACGCLLGLCMTLGVMTGLAQDDTAAHSSRAVLGTVTEPEKALQITVLNVEKADAILLQYQGHAMLIDTGLAETQDRVLQALQKRQVTALDAVLISHPHTDHLGGFQAVCDAVPIGQVYDNGQVSKKEFYTQYRQQVTARHIPRRVLRKGDVISLGTDVQIHVLAPETMFTAKTLPRASLTGIFNNNSLVCRVTYHNFSMLFMGDAQKDEERQLLQTPAVLSANVLKVGHHGSKTSTLPEFVKAVHPDCAVISCSPYRPVPESKQYALETLQNQGAAIYQTAQHGTITIRSDGKRYDIQTAY